MAASEIETSSEDGAGTSGFPFESGWKSSTSKCGGSGQPEGLAAPLAVRHSSERRNCTGAMRPTPVGSPLGARPAATTVSPGSTDFTAA